MAPLAARSLSEGDQLRARVASLEDERRRAFDEAQREADAMFAQYQLSQLLASGDNLEKLAPAVLAEIARTSGAGTAALWLAAAPPDRGPRGDGGRRARRARRRHPLRRRPPGAVHGLERG